MKSNMAVKAAAFAAALSLVLSGCSSDDASTDDDTTTDQTTETTAADGGELTAADIAQAIIDECANYEGTKGIEGNVIKIGNVHPESGKYAPYATVLEGFKAFIEYTNSQGGITAGDGKQYTLEMVSADDEYNPANTMGATKRLVEEEGIFAMVGQIGTENVGQVRDYMNESCVPSISIASGATRWGNSVSYPWYISGLPAYALEAHAYIEHLKETKPNAKIALLYQDDDYGKSYKAAIEIAIEGTDITIAEERAFNPLNEASSEVKVAELAASGADVFFVGMGGLPCPQAVGQVPATWTPETFVSITCSADVLTKLMDPKGLDLWAVKGFLDPANPEDAAVGDLAQFMETGAAMGLDPATLTGGVAAAGWNFGALFAKGLENAETVDRASVMAALWTLENESIGIMLPGAVANTNIQTDPWVYEDVQLINRKDGAWVAATELTSYDGQSKAFGGPDSDK